MPVRVVSGRQTRRPRIGNHLFGSFAHDFSTADGARIMVVALTGRHFADLASVTGLTDTLAELGRLLGADFTADGDRYEHREVLDSLFARWFAGRDLAEVRRELDQTSVLWSRYRDFAELTAEEARAGNPLLQEIAQPGWARCWRPGRRWYVKPARCIATGRRLCIIYFMRNLKAAS